MKYVTFSLVLAVSFLILITSVYAEALHTDILRKFFTITGAATEVTEETITETTETTTETVEPEPEVTTEEVTEETPPVEEVVEEAPAEEVPPVEEEPIIVEEICPMMPMIMPTCPEGEFPETIYDEKGCPVDFQCTPMIEPIKGEEPIYCPVDQTCPDGSTVPCRIEDNNCICGPCPIPGENIPEGCWQEVDTETGFVKIVCEEIETCPDEAIQAEMKHRCIEEGGNPVPFQDPSGCTFYDCRFGEHGEVGPNPIYGYEECPPEEEIELVIRKCEDVGLFGTISFEGGCRVAKCIEGKREICKVITAEMRLRIEEECERRGLRAMKDFDENGCEYFACAGEEFCKRDLPREAFEECRERGGEMVIKRDEMGCVVYSNCVERGDERNIYVEPMERVPEPTELLTIAFKLEQLKIELDKLARQADDIAAYYASVGDPEEHRFRRISGMFEAIKDKIDEIKNNLRERLDTLTPEDMEQIRFDIRSVKESLKDIVYIMLSNSDDVKEMIQAEVARERPGLPPERLPYEEIPPEGTNCGTDGGCFDRAIRVCKPVTFLPEGRAGPTVTIKGLEGDACILHVELPKGMGPPDFPGTIWMDCRLTDYSFGVRGPEDVLPYCEGPMKEMIEKYGMGPPGGPGGPPGGPEAFGGPGGCTSDIECREYCERNPEECLRWCRENPGMCPPEAEFHLKQAIEGRGFEFVLCTPEDEMAWKECENRGGRPQSDPSPEGCEIYTDCVMPELREVQPCVGCLNNGICDVGECSECIDCLKR